MHLNKQTIGIDALNIRQGGGITHLKEILARADPDKDNFQRVVIWGGKKLLSSLEDKEWLIKEEINAKNFFSRTCWQIFKLSKALKEKKCDLLFVPGGSFTTKFKPTVILNNNLLPFELKESLWYGFSLITLKYLLLSFSQKSSFKRSDGIIFLSNYAKRIVQNKINHRNTVVINHGINERFFFKRKIKEFRQKDEIRIINVSAIEPYKDQKKIVKAINILNKEGFNLKLFIYGDGHSPTKKKLIKYINKCDETKNTFFLEGSINYSKLEEVYKKADIKIYTSHCESFGQTLTESMASSLPILSSDKGPMRELLGEDNGIFFDLNNVDTLIASLKKITKSFELRDSLSTKAYNMSKNYSWEKTTRETFSFFRSVYENHERYFQK